MIQHLFSGIETKSFPNNAFSSLYQLELKAEQHIRHLKLQSLENRISQYIGLALGAYPDYLFP